MAWYNPNWKYRIKINSTNSRVTADFTDFPCYVNLSLLGVDFWSHVQNGGADIRITRSDAVTECAREIVSCNTATDTGELWFLANSLLNVTDVDYYIYYGNNNVTEPEANSTYGSQNVWSNYWTVLHCAQQPNGADSILDSTSNANHFTSYNMETTDRVDGKFTYGLDFGGTDEYLEKAAALITTTPFSFQCWMKTTTTTSEMAMIGVGDTTTDTYESVLGISVSQPTTPVVMAYTRGTTTATVAYCSAAYTSGAWFLVHGTWPDVNNRNVYMNGANAVNASNAKTYSGYDTTRIGQRLRTAGGTFTIGTLSEMRICKTALSAQWIETEASNHTSTAFFTIGTEEFRFLTWNGLSIANIKEFNGTNIDNINL